MIMATATAYSKREIAFDELGKGKLRRDSHPISRVVCCSRLYLRRKGARREEGCSHTLLSSREGPGLKPGISKSGPFQEGGSILQGPLRHLFFQSMAQVKNSPSNFHYFSNINGELFHPYGECWLIGIVLCFIPLLVGCCHES